MRLLYYLFVRHHWTPGMYAGMSRGEQDLVWGLASHELDELNKK